MHRKIASITMLAGLTAIRLWSAQYCQGPYCRAYISNRPVPQIAQQTPVWCWAASMSMLFAYYGHPVQQAEIVARYFGAPVPVEGPPLVMKEALNTTWQDDNGRWFTVSSRITDLYSQNAYQVTNSDVVNALAHEQPVYYGDQTHAMILVQVDYIQGPYGPEISEGYVIDPWPFSFGFRPLQPQEMQAMFLAISTLQELPPPNLPAITSVTNAASYLPELTAQGFGSIFGKNLAPAKATWDGAVVNGNLPVTLQGTRVLVNGQEAYLSAVSPTQINFVVPATNALGPVPVTVITAAGRATANVSIKPRSIGIFTNVWTQRFYAIAQPTASPNKLIGPGAAIPGTTRPAIRGEYLQLYVTGMGATTPHVPDGRVITRPYPVSDLSGVRVNFGGVSAPASYAGMTYPGVFQVNVKVPTNAPTGDIPFTIEMGSDRSQSNVYLSVQ